MIEATTNIKHKPVLMFLYYAGLRLNEVRNLKRQDIDFERDVVYIKKLLREKKEPCFYILN